MLDIDDDQSRVRSVFLKKLVYFNVVGFELGAGGVPAYHLLFGIDLDVFVSGEVNEEQHLSEHFIHTLMVDVIQEPDSGLLRVLFKRHCVGVSDAEGSF